MRKRLAASSPAIETSSTNATIAIAACKVDVSYNQFGTPGFSLFAYPLQGSTNADDCWPLRYFCASLQPLKIVRLVNASAQLTLRMREFLKHLHDSFLNRLFDTL